MRFDAKWLILTASALFIGCGGKTMDEETTGGGGGGGGGSSSVSSSASGEPCMDAKTLVGTIDKVTTGEVRDLSMMPPMMPEEKVIYIDASAGGATGQAINPWIYVSLSKASRVEVTDVSEFTSMEWDLSMKRSA